MNRGLALLLPFPLLGGCTIDLMDVEPEVEPARASLTLLHVRGESPTDDRRLAIRVFLTPGRDASGRRRSVEGALRIDGEALAAQRLQGGVLQWELEKLEPSPCSWLVDVVFPPAGDLPAAEFSVPCDVAMEPVDEVVAPGAPLRFFVRSDPPDDAAGERSEWSLSLSGADDPGRPLVLMRVAGPPPPEIAVPAGLLPSDHPAEMIAQIRISSIHRLVLADSMQLVSVSTAREARSTVRVEPPGLAPGIPAERRRPFAARRGHPPAGGS